MFISYLLSNRLLLLCTAIFAVIAITATINAQNQDVTLHLKPEGCEALKQLANVPFASRPNPPSCTLEHVNIKLRSVLDPEMVQAELRDGVEFALQRKMIAAIEKQKTPQK